MYNYKVLNNSISNQGNHFLADFLADFLAFLPPFLDFLIAFDFGAFLAALFPPLLAILLN